MAYSVSTKIEWKNDPNSNGTTPLHIACKRGDFKIVYFLVENGADINSINCRGKSPLIIATENEWPEIVKFLLEENACINEVDGEGNSALSIAIAKHFCDIPPKLLEKVANGDLSGFRSLANSKIKENVTPVAKMLITFGADLNFTNGIKNKTALMFAADILDMELVRDLIDSKKVELDEVDESGNTVLMRVLEDVKKNDNLESPFFSSDEKSLQELIKFLVTQGADLSVRNSDGNTALHLAATTFSPTALKTIIDQININQSKPIAKLPRNRTIKILESQLEVLNKMNQTPLHLAVASGRYKNVQLLVEAGAYVDSKSKDM